MTIRKAINLNKVFYPRRGVPLSEVYSSVFENFHFAYTGGVGQSYVEVNASAQCG